VRLPVSIFPHLGGAVLIAAAVALSACTVTPLYGEGPAGESIRADLAAISVLPAADRTDQLVRNELIFAFTGGSAPAAPRYELSLDATMSGGGLNLANPTELSATVTVTVRYSLVELATAAVLGTASLSVSTRYIRSNSAFANVRADQDAEQRAAVEVARQLARDIAAILATRS
jgi:LPS-assembly lipoprotein